MFFRSLPLLGSFVLASSACGGSEGSLDSAGSPLVGTWAATVESADGQSTSTVTWRFAADGTWASSVAVTSGNVETTTCTPDVPADTHWDNDQAKVALRAGITTTVRAYELTESGQRLRLEPPVPAFQSAGSVTVNTYARTADAPLTACAKK